MTSQTRGACARLGRVLHEYQGPAKERLPESRMPLKDMRTIIFKQRPLQRIIENEYITWLGAFLDERNHLPVFAFGYESFQ